LFITDNQQLNITVPHITYLKKQNKNKQQNNRLGNTQIVKKTCAKSFVYFKHLIGDYTRIGLY